MQFRMFRSEAQGRAIAPLGFGRTAETIDYVPEIVERVGKVLLEAQCRPYACRGFLPAPEIDEHTSEIAVCVGKVRLQAQCLT